MGSLGYTDKNKKFLKLSDYISVLNTIKVDYIILCMKRED
jgi:hypothetical protein